MTFDSTFTSNSNDNSNNSLRKKVVVGGAMALLLGVATYSSNGTSNGWGKNLLRSTQGTHIATLTDTDVALACSTIKTQVDAALGTINEELAALDKYLFLKQDAVFQQKDVPLNDKGCRGDITITVAQGASVSGLRDTTLAVTEQDCAFNLLTQALTGKWILWGSSSLIWVDATVTTKATNCDIDNSVSVTITVPKPTVSASASVAARVSLSPLEATIQTVSVDEVTVGFASASVRLSPPMTVTSYPFYEAHAITDAINKHVVPEVNKFIAERMPTTINASNVATPKEIRAAFLSLLRRLIGSRMI